MIYKCLKDCLVFMKVTFNWGRFAGGGGDVRGIRWIMKNKSMIELF